MRIQDGQSAELFKTNQHRAAESQRLDQGGSAESHERLRHATVDRLEVSDLAQKVSRALDMSEAARSSEIEQMRRAYANGTLQIEPLAISRGILSEALFLGRLESDQNQ